MFHTPRTCTQRKNDNVSLCVYGWCVEEGIWTSLQLWQSADGFLMHYHLRGFLISTARWQHTVITITACLEGSKLCYRHTSSSSRGLCSYLHVSKRPIWNPLVSPSFSSSREAISQYSYTRFHPSGYVQTLGVSCAEGLALQCSSLC